MAISIQQNVSIHEYIGISSVRYLTKNGGTYFPNFFQMLEKKLGMALFNPSLLWTHLDAQFPDALDAL